MTIDFIKMHGLGNDYIYVDCIRSSQPVGVTELAVRLSDRHFGIGGDGLVLILPSEVADCRMRMFNADGSESPMCGNAVRCVGKYVYESGYVNVPELTVETLSGIKKLTLDVVDGVVNGVTVDMGIVSLDPLTVPVVSDTPFIARPISIYGQTHIATAVSVGNPHLVIPMIGIDDYPFDKYGPEWERHPLFPDRVNTEIVEQLSSTHLRMRVWERGTGETLACGTGACAAVVAFTEMNLIPVDTPITVTLAGGDLVIRYLLSRHVIMTGPATVVFHGTVIV